MGSFAQWGLASLVFVLGSVTLFFAFGPVDWRTAGNPEFAVIGEDRLTRTLAELAEDVNLLRGEELMLGIVVGGATLEQGRLLTLNFLLPPDFEGRVSDKSATEMARQVQRQVCRLRLLRRAFDAGGVINCVYRQASGGEYLNVVFSQRICSSMA